MRNLSVCRMLLHLLSLLAVHAVHSSPAPGPTPLPGYALVPALSDEFTGSTLDATKWTAHSPGWPGRQPGLFSPSNVVVAGGQLQLWARSARRNASWPPGYDNYTTAAVHSMATQRLGYFEIRWRSGSSGISSSWWFHNNNGTEWTEIDMFETTGVTNRGTSWGTNASVLPSHVHVFALPGVPPSALPQACGGCKEGTPGTPPCSKPSSYVLPPAAPTFAQDFHTCALNWTEAGVQVSLDGVVVNTIASPCLTQPLGMDFDRETMPGWMALPDPASLPDSPFEVDYVRSWEKL
jgi:beta-glucanase (GH16 family)